MEHKASRIAMTLREVDDIVADWTNAGYLFVGKGVEYDSSNTCPSCGQVRYGVIGISMWINKAVTHDGIPVGRFIHQCSCGCMWWE